MGQKETTIRTLETTPEEANDSKDGWEDVR